MVMLERADRHETGIITITDRVTGKMISEGNVRTCCHCGFIWKHKPGSGILRGYCQKCDAFSCGKQSCWDCYPKEQQIEDMEAVVRGNRASIEAAVRRQNHREQIYQYLTKKRRVGEDRRLMSN